MIRRSRHFLALTAIVAACGALPASGNTESGPARYPTLYVVYTMNCTFSVVNDAGQPVTSIAPGNYQVDVRSPIGFGTIPLNLTGPNDMTACRGMAQFQLAGPGVNLTTTMTAGCMSDAVLTANLQPSATYIAEDNNQPSVTRTVFTTLAAGSPAAPPPLTSSGTGSSTSTDIVGSALGSSLRGTLSALVSSTGKTTLTSKGKPVLSLKTGRYKLSITDAAASAGFTIRQAKGAAIVAATSVAFTGKESSVVKLKAGQWMYYSGSGKIHYFTVKA